ncbi:DUF6538 domain-containing protein [Sphingomonas sp. CFBP8993]|nr:DUF6538 domain-containing protein [Sphingomonas sp. CFBP8993]
MATPWKHPSTGVYYLRRQIPEKLRPAFDGKALWKVSLGTKNGSEATVLFLQANAALEQRFEEARARLKATGSPCPSARTVPTNWSRRIFKAPS